MATSMLSPLTAAIGPGQRQEDEDTGRVPLDAQCGHCDATDAAWPVRLAGGEGPLICVRCGGWLNSRGGTVDVCSVCALPRGFLGHGDKGCPVDESALERMAASPTEREELGVRVFRAATELYEPCQPNGLERYVAGVFDKVGATGSAKIVFVDLGEPAVALLPRGDLVLTLGLLAALEDEAQLAFVLAREVALDRSGWIWRRFGAASKRNRGWLRRLAFRSRNSLVEAVDLTFQMGYGPEAERAADRSALATLVHADYEPSSAVRALRLLEGAALAGTGGRFLLAADRAGWLEESALALGRTPTARLNREVYRRAVDGFNVFGR